MGEQIWKGEMEIPNIIMLGLSEKLSEQKEGNTLHRLLGILFSNTLDADEKISILEKEYHIPMEIFLCPEKDRRDQRTKSAPF